MATLFKAFLIACLVIGGYTLVAHYFPQWLSANIFQIAGFTMTGGLLLIVGLVVAGVKWVKFGH